MARGRVWKRGTSWCLRYEAGTDEQSGRRIQPFESGFLTQHEAEARLAQRMHEVATGRHVRQSKQTFGAFAQYWLDTIAAGTVRPSSRERYQESLDYHLLPALGHLPLQGLKASHIRRAYGAWERQGLAPNTRSNLHARLTQILAAAVREHLIVRSPLEEVAAPHVAKTEMRVWTAEQLDQFLTATATVPFWGALWHVYGMTGMRRAEALGLKWSDLDWEQGHIRVRRQIVQDGRACRFGDLKTAASRRTIAVGKDTVGVLHAHRKAQAEQRLAAALWHDHDLVFARQPERAGTQPPGSMWAPDVVSSRWARMIRTTTFPPIRLHDLRHTHATILLRVDGNVKAIATRLGHDPVVLLRTYAHALVEDQERGIARFEAALAGTRHAAPQTASRGV